MSPYRRHISEWEERHNTLFTQVLKGWISAIFLLGTVELKDVPVVQLERTSGWLGQENQCCTVPLWLQDTGSGWCGNSHFSLGFWRGNMATWVCSTDVSGDPNLGFQIRKLREWRICGFRNCSGPVCSGSLLFIADLQSPATLFFFFFSQQYWWAVWAGACLSLSFLATSVSFVRWREKSISMLGLSSD